MASPEEFEAFMRKYQDMVYTAAVRLVRSGAEAEDIAQEVFLKAYDRFSELKDNPSAGGWLKTVAGNLSLNHLSRYRARWRFFGEFLDEEKPELELPAPDRMDEELEARDRQALIEAALQALPDAQRVPLVLFHYEELSYETIAKKLGASLSKIKTDIFRGRAALRQALEEQIA